MNNNLSAVIPIGGKGTRLKKITNNIPKPVFPINGTSTLYRSIKSLINYNIKDIHITMGYENEICIKHIEEIEKELSVSINVHKESEPLGECGSLWEIIDLISDQFLFVLGDLIYSLNFDKLITFHERLGSQLTLVTHTSDHPHDSDLVSVPNGVKVEQIYSKSSNEHSNVNAYLGYTGISLINKELILNINRPTSIESSSLFHHLVVNVLNSKQRIFSYNTTEYIHDMGTIDRFNKVKNDLKLNYVEPKNYSNLQTALFIDRDNTIIKCDIGNYVTNTEQIEYLISNIKKLEILSRNFNMVCLVTNQPQISMGKLSINGLDHIHSKIVKTCLDFNLKIDIITFCPHHPHGGFNEEIKELKTDCFCRKPNPGLLFEQAFLRNIDLKNSLMVGDSIVDELTAKNSDCKFRYINQL